MKRLNAEDLTVESFTTSGGASLLPSSPTDPPICQTDDTACTAPTAPNRTCVC